MEIASTQTHGVNFHWLWGPCLIAISAWPFVHSLPHRQMLNRQIGALDEDENAKPTPESIQSFSNPSIFSAMIGCSIIQLLLSLVFLILAYTVVPQISVLLHVVHILLYVSTHSFVMVFLTEVKM